MSYATNIANTLQQKNALTVCTVEDCERRETAIALLPQAVTPTSGAILPMLDLGLFLSPKTCLQIPVLYINGSGWSTFASRCLTYANLNVML